MKERPSPRELGGLFLVGLAVFVAEMALMRVMAQVTWPPFAFLALSAAMLGGGVACTVLAVRPRWLRHPLAPLTGALLVAAGAPVALLVALLAGLEPLRVSSSLAEALTFMLALAVLCVPFVGLALALAALLERHPDDATRVYGADLLGAGVGGALSVALLDALGTFGSAALAGTVAGLGAALLTRQRWLQGISLAVGAASLFGVIPGMAPLPRPTEDKLIGELPATEGLRKVASAGLLRTFDRSDGRVDVVPASPSPALLIDLGAALARAPEPEVGRTKPRDAVSASFLAKPPEGARVLVIGSAAGYEVARALAHGAAHVDAVEVSSAVVAAALSDRMPTSRRALTDERVALHVDEARSFLERTDERWDHIVAVHTISNAAVSASAMRLAEDFLLTRESLRTLLAHLDDDGVLYLTRPASQIALLADLARAALEERGVPRADVDEHLALLDSIKPDPFFAGLLVFARATPLERVPAPVGVVVKRPPPPTGRPLPTDERPFFHRLSDDVDPGERARLLIEGPGLAEAALAWVGGLAVLVALIAVVLPLLFRRREGGGRPALPHLGVALCLGLGFMLVEIALAQRLTLLCGRPQVAFAAVVGGMLVGAGAGALALSSRRVRLEAALLASALLASAAVLVPPLLVEGGALAWPSFARALVTGLVAAGIAAPLGLGFPALVRDAAETAPGSAPWLYAINATAGVGATALYATVAPTLGLAGASVLGSALYALGFALALLVAARGAAGKTGLSTRNL